MTSHPTREEFVGYIHQPLPNGGTGGSPTKSTLRYRWRELRDWDIEEEARTYWEGLSDKNDVISHVHSAHWEMVQSSLDALMEPFTMESTLRAPFSTAYQITHNLAIVGANDPHAVMRIGVGSLDIVPLSNPDLIFVYEGQLAGIVELKTWWKVDETQINDVRTGNILTVNKGANNDRERSIARSSSRPTCSGTGVRLHGTRQDSLRNPLDL